MTCGLLAVLAVGWLSWREVAARRQSREVVAPTIIKQPIVFASRTFDPAAPPADMPSLATGENAVCDSNFRSSARLSPEAILVNLE